MLCAFTLLMRLQLIRLFAQSHSGNPDGLLSMFDLGRLETRRSRGVQLLQRQVRGHPVRRSNQVRRRTSWAVPVGTEVCLGVARTIECVPSLGMSRTSFTILTGNGFEY